MTDPRLTFLSDLVDGDASGLLTRLTDTPIVIAAEGDTASCRSGQVLLLHLVQLLSRLFDSVTVEVPEVKNLVGSPLAPGDTLAAGLAYMAEPDPRRPTALSSIPRPGIRVQVGSLGDMARTGLETRVYVGASEWSASVSIDEPQAVVDGPLPVGPLAAAALGAGEVFKLVFADVLHGVVPLGGTGPSGYRLSLLDYGEGAVDAPAVPESRRVDLVMVGCGSIGCALLEGLLLVPQLAGTIAVVDNGTFDERNPYKYLGLDWASAAAKRPKALWAARRIAAATGERVRGLAYSGTIDQYVASLPVDYRIQLLASAVDTVDARMSIQDALPRRIVNAGIAGTLVEVSVHGFGEGACLACLALETARESWDVRPIVARTGLPEPRVRSLMADNDGMTAADLTAIRGAGVLPAPLLAVLDAYLGQPILTLYARAAYAEATARAAGGQEIRITTAFVSAFAGALLLAELLKEIIPALMPYRVNNSYRQEMLGVPVGGQFRYPRDSTGRCTCHSGIRNRAYAAKYVHRLKGEAG